MLTCPKCLKDYNYARGSICDTCACKLRNMKCHRGHQMVRTISGKVHCRTCKLLGPDVLAYEQRVDALTKILTSAGYSPEVARKQAILLIG